MTLVERINADLKQALLSGDKELVSVLRGLKSEILNEEVAKGMRDSGLEEQTIVSIFQREVKKRNEAIDLYKKAGDDKRARQEEYEVAVIKNYLPEMLSEVETLKLVEDAIKKLGASDMSNMGQVIGEVKKQGGNKVDAALAAKIAKEKLA